MNGPHELDVPENVFGSQKRLAWIRSNLEVDDLVLDFGCGTGVMITLPLIAEGVDARGIDAHAPSIEYGQAVCRRLGLDASRLSTAELDTVDFRPTVVIASEVLEHIEDSDLGQVLRSLRRLIATDGHMLVTVPNGSGWFEREAAIWRRSGLGWLMERLHVPGLARRVKEAALRRRITSRHPSTMADDVSPHVQRFTHESIRALLEESGFEVETFTGSTFVAGPISDMILTGFARVMDWNARLADLHPRLAAGYMIRCRPI